jgi:DNA-binding cell septation regulator SpoVG
MDRKDIWIDFGFSGLTKWFGSPWAGEHTPVEIVVLAADWGEGAYAPTLLDDAVGLLDSPLPTRVIDILWCAAVGMEFVPDARWVDGRDWLRQIVDVCEERIRRGESRSVAHPQASAWDPELRDAVLAEVRALAPELDRATADHPYYGVPEVVPSLERVVTEVDPDLGFRLFLRVLKAYLVPISESQHLRYRELGERFEYNEFVVDDGTLQFQVEDLISHG